MEGREPLRTTAHEREVFEERFLGEENVARGLNGKLSYDELEDLGHAFYGKLDTSHPRYSERALYGSGLHGQELLELVIKFRAEKDISDELAQALYGFDPDGGAVRSSIDVFDEKSGKFLEAEYSMDSSGVAVHYKDLGVAASWTEIGNMQLRLFRDEWAYHMGLQYVPSTTGHATEEEREIFIRLFISQGEESLAQGRISEPGILAAEETEKLAEAFYAESISFDNPIFRNRTDEDGGPVRYMTEEEFFDLASRYHNGEDISTELAQTLLGYRAWGNTEMQILYRDLPTKSLDEYKELSIPANEYKELSITYSMSESGIRVECKNMSYSLSWKDLGDMQLKLFRKEWDARVRQEARSARQAEEEIQLQNKRIALETARRKGVMPVALTQEYVMRRVVETFQHIVDNHIYPEDEKYRAIDVLFDSTLRTIKEDHLIDEQYAAQIEQLMKNRHRYTDEQITMLCALTNLNRDISGLMYPFLTPERMYKRATGYYEGEDLPIRGDLLENIRKMQAYGYADWDSPEEISMLPTDARTGMSYVHMIPVFLLHPDGTKTQAENTDQVDQHVKNGGMVGIERADWVKVLKFRDDRRMKRILANEQAVKMPRNFAIYQMKDEYWHSYGFEPYERIAGKFEIREDHYDLIYAEAVSPERAISLDALFERFNIMIPNDYYGHSLSISDIVVQTEDGKRTAYYCDRRGWTEVPEFLMEKEIRKQEQMQDLTYVFLNGYRCIKVDEWESEEYRYIIGNSVDDSEFYYARVGSKVFEYDYQPDREKVESDYVDYLAAREIDRLEAVADGFTEEVTEKSETEDLTAEKEKQIIKAYKEETDRHFKPAPFTPYDFMKARGLEHYAKKLMQRVIDEHDLGVEIVDAAVCGSRSRGLEHGLSDYNVAIEYRAKEGFSLPPETMMANLLRDRLVRDNAQFENRPLHINPLTKEESGSLGEFLQREEARLLEKRNALQENDKRLSDEVDAVLNGTYGRHNAVKICDTPEILQAVGCKQLPMLYTQQHLRNALGQAKNPKDHVHDITPTITKNASSSLRNPVMIMDSLTKNDSILVLTDQIDTKGCPVIIAIKPGGNGTYELQNVDSNFVLSMYGKNRIDRLVTKSLINQKILFWDKNKSQALFSVLQLQLPQGLNNLDYNLILHKSDSIVNGNREKSEEISEQENKSQVQQEPKKQDVNYRPKSR